MTNKKLTRNNKGLSKCPEYIALREIKYRCNTVTAKAYPLYGGRGIKVSPVFMGKDGFKNFYLHVGPRPSDKHSIDRIDNNGNYEPGNLRWTDQKTQSNNTRSVKPVLGLPSMSEFARIHNISPYNVAFRLKNKWDKKDLSKPARQKLQKRTLADIGKMIENHKNGLTKRQAAASIGAHKNSFMALYRRYVNETKNT